MISMQESYSSVSVFIIGTEITRGIIGDKHGQLIAKELTTIGYLVNRITIVADDGSVKPLLEGCIRKNDIIILTGGLGPTSDDMTRQIVADLANVPLVEDPGAYETLYKRIGSRINGANRRQVLIPQGFKVIENPKGTAPGFSGEIKVDGRSVRLYAMPGPPIEMHEMFYNKILPELSSLTGHEGIGRSEYSNFLTPESRLEDLSKECAIKGIEWGTRVQEHRISLYLNGGTVSQRDEMALCISNKLGRGILRSGDVEILDLLVDLLKKENITISAAESCTGGLLSKLLTDLSGSSNWFWGSVISYSNDAKTKLLNVKEETLEKYGAVSVECVKEMAQGALEVSQSDVAVSISGIAGPDGGSKEKPVGTICFGFAQKGKKSEAVELLLTSYGRSGVRKRGAIAALLLTYYYIRGESLLDIVTSWQYI
ncbi:MAG: nicotinamide-nucleotide amidohydrolase family protein [Sphaerochaetaceae bacterium]|jgi:nicotinamide-nucleotide amidase